MLDEADAFEFVLAEKLGLTLGQVRAMPNSEYVEWQCFWEYRHALQQAQGH